MQLDFLAKLTAVAKRVIGKKPAPPPESDPLTDRAQWLLCGIGCTDLAARVAVRWNPRMRSTAGMAYPGKALIVLNPRLQEFGEGEIDRTLRHELAHLLAHHRAGRRRIAPHGPEWRAACHDLGLTDEKRCHNLPFPQRKMAKPHRYRCPRCAVEIARARPMRRKCACLLCCRAHSRGEYDERFRFIKLPIR